LFEILEAVDACAEWPFICSGGALEALNEGLNGFEGWRCGGGFTVASVGFSLASWAFQLIAEAAARSSDCDLRVK
jgi:hypothetical protein